MEKIETSNFYIWKVKVPGNFRSNYPSNDIIARWKKNFRTGHVPHRRSKLWQTAVKEVTIFKPRYHGKIVNLANYLLFLLFLLIIIIFFDGWLCINWDIVFFDFIFIFQSFQDTRKILRRGYLQLSSRPITVILFIPSLNAPNHK